MSKICMTIFTFHTMHMLRNSKMVARMAIDANQNVPSAMVSVECWFGEPGVGEPITEASHVKICAGPRIRHSVVATEVRT